MVKRVELGKSYIVPKGLLGFYAYIRQIREIRNILTNRAAKRPIYVYVES